MDAEIPGMPSGFLLFGQLSWCETGANEGFTRFRIVLIAFDIFARHIESHV